MCVSDDDGFVRPRTGGSRLWETLVTVENTTAEDTEGTER
jgi:hypothetical protein